MSGLSDKSTMLPALGFVRQKALVASQSEWMFGSLMAQASYALGALQLDVARFCRHSARKTPQP